MPNISGSFVLSGAITQKDSNGLVIPDGLSRTIRHQAFYGPGAGSNHVDLFYGDEVTISSPLTLDLRALPDVEVGGGAATARVRELVILVPDPASQPVTVHAGTPDGWAILPPSSSPLTVMPGGLIRLCDPYSSGDNAGYVANQFSCTVTIDPGIHTVTVGIIVAGDGVA